MRPGEKGCVSGHAPDLCEGRHKAEFGGARLRQGTEGERGEKGVRKGLGKRGEKDYETIEANLAKLTSHPLNHTLEDKPSKFLPLELSFFYTRQFIPFI